MNLKLPRSFAVVSGKGGAGKTVFSLTIARALANRVRYVGEEDPKILLIDMDFHVRGLTYLINKQLKEIENFSITTYSVLKTGRKLQAQTFLKQISEQTIAQSIYFLPSTNSPTEIDWVNLHTWSINRIRKGVANILKLAKAAGINHVIFDTRAGPDNTSLAVALETNLSFILVEPDAVSFRSSQILFANFSRLLDTSKKLSRTRRNFVTPQMRFVLNKTLGLRNNDIENTLKHMSFLSPIPFDKPFMERFASNAFDATSDKVLDQSMGLYIQRTLFDGLSVIETPEISSTILVPSIWVQLFWERLRQWNSLLIGFILFTLGLVFFMFSSSGLQLLISSLIEVGALLVFLSVLLSILNRPRVILRDVSRVDQTKK